MLSPSDDLKAMITAARAAGDGLQRRFAQLSELTVRAKSGPTDLVSIADEEAEQTTRGLLARARPAYGFLGEEGGSFGGSDDANTWIVDPLDGTTNFLFAAPLWGVNIALQREAEIVAGVTYMPALGEMFVAEKGQGAWLNGQQIRVSKRDALIDAVLSCGIPFNGKPHQAAFAREMALLTPNVAGIRRTGAGAVDMAWVAAGRWDAYWERLTYAWDMAAGVVLVREAGGKATSVTGGPLDIHANNICMTNGFIHDALLERLNTALQQE